MKFPLVEIAIAVKFDPFPYNLLLLSGLVRVRVGPNEPLDRLRPTVRLAEPEPLRIFVPGVFQNGDAVVDQAPVLVRQEKGDCDEDQSQEEIFGSGYLFSS